jgi:hypothetical protein
MNIGIVTFDRWNSFDIQRDLKDIGIRTDTLSVAKKHYEDLSMLVYEERVAAPHIDILKDELLELRIMRNDRVDHPRKKSKDLADALCGSVYNCISHSRRENTREINIHTWSSANKDRKNEMPQEPKKQEMSEEIRDYLGKFNLI